MFSFYCHQNSGIYRNYESSRVSSWRRIGLFSWIIFFWIIFFCLDYFLLFLKKDKHNIPFLKKINKLKIAWNTSELIFLCQQIDTVLGKDQKAQLCEAENDGEARCAAAHRVTKGRWRPGEGATETLHQSRWDAACSLLPSQRTRLITRTGGRDCRHRESLRHCLRPRS